MIRYLKFALPFVIFILIIIVFKQGLKNDPHHLPSPLIDKPIPIFNVATLDSEQPVLSTTLFKGHITLLNVWASWCSSCQQEIPILNDLTRQSIRVIGLNYKDTKQAALTFISQQTNPYQLVLFDPYGKIAMQLGVFGTPESFLIDKRGTIRFRYTGALSLSLLEKDLLPRIKALEEEA